MVHVNNFWRLFFIITISIFITIFGLKAQNSLDSQFKKYEIHEINSEEVSFNLKANKSIIKAIKLLGYSLELVESDIIASDYKSITSSAASSQKSNLAIPYQGYTKEGGRISITIGKQFIFGYIEDGVELIYLEPLSTFDSSASPDQFISYKSSDVKIDSPKTCGVTEVYKVKQQAQSLVTGNCYDVEYAICNDYSMYTKYGSSITNVENRAIAIVNNVNTDYDDAFADQLNLVITGQYTVDCAGCDPWTSSTNPGALLPSFANWAKNNLNIAHDVSSLWSDRNFDGSTIGLAYLDAVCNFNIRYNILEDFSSNASLLRVLTSHELGHNFGSGHVDGTTTFIMSPTVNGSTTWNTNSIAQIESYYNGINCLSTCIPTGTTPSISFTNASSIVSEESTTGSSSSCNLNYVETNINIALSNQPTSNITASILVDNISTANSGFDFELITQSVTFAVGQSLSKTIQILIHEDHIEETLEEIQLSYQITAGNATDGDNTTHTILIEDPNDFVSTSCCSGETSVEYGNYNYNFGLVFFGDYEDSRSRTVILASELTQAGLTGGDIDELSLYVSEKLSNGAFNDFRVGITQVTNSNLQGLSWIPTTEVYFGNYTTTSGENQFPFSTPFNWDGTSNLYIEFCYNNSSTVGNDILQGTIPLVSNSTQMTQYQINNNADGCNNIATSLTYNYTVPIQPQIKFTNGFGAIAATTLSSATSNIRNGETANLYNSDQEIIVSVDNIGSTDVDCLSSEVFTSVSNKLNANFGSGSYSEKTYYIEGDNSSNYEVSLYYTDAELATWGGNVTNLSIVRSNVPLDSASSTDVEIISPNSITTNHLGNTQVMFKGNFSDFGYFSLTDISPEVPTGDIENTDLVIGASNRGLLLKAPNGTKYRIYSNGSSLSIQATSGEPKACMETGDLFITNSSNSILFKKPSSGYTQLNVSNSGTISYSSVSSLPTQKILLESGDLEIGQIGKGLILKSSNGTCWKISVTNGGTIETSSLGSCP